MVWLGLVVWVFWVDLRISAGAVVCGFLIGVAALVAGLVFCLSSYVVWVTLLVGVDLVVWY